jgi:hypothetical protein
VKTVDWWSDAARTKTFELADRVWLDPEFFGGAGAENRTEGKPGIVVSATYETDPGTPVARNECEVSWDTGFVAPAPTAWLVPVQCEQCERPIQIDPMAGKPPSVRDHCIGVERCLQRAKG